MNAEKFEAMTVRDGGKLVTLRSYDELRQFLRPPTGVRPVGVAKKVAEAETEGDKAAAVLAFRTWVRLAGRLEREHA